MAAEIKYKIIGNPNFLRDMSYNAHIPGFLKEFEDKFKLADEVLIEFEESINPNPNKPVRDIPSVSEDGTVIKVVYKTARHNQPKGGLSKPSATEFLTGLRYYLENTVVSEDNKRFDDLNNNQVEE
jgi:hypothetical protein